MIVFGETGRLFRAKHRVTQSIIKSCERGTPISFPAKILFQFPSQRGHISYVGRHFLITNSSRAERAALNLRLHREAALTRQNFRLSIHGSFGYLGHVFLFKTFVSISNLVTFASYDSDCPCCTDCFHQWGTSVTLYVERVPISTLHVLTTSCVGL